eukprot:363130-Chlamydomonas_euryale.AAC.5
MVDVREEGKHMNRAAKRITGASERHMLRGKLGESNELRRTCRRAPCCTGRAGGLHAAFTARCTAWSLTLHPRIHSIY